MRLQQRVLRRLARPTKSIGKYFSSRSVIRALALAIICLQVSTAGAQSTTLLPQGCHVADTPLVTSPVWDISPDGGSFKTMYIMPTGTLSERLAAVASAATLARNAQVNLIVVWPEGGEVDFAAAWSDLYQSPKLPTGPFPSGKYSQIEDPKCKVHMIESYIDYQAVQNNWEEVSHHTNEQALCLLSSSNFLPGSKDAAWFYKLLTPSPQVLALAAPFIEEQQWSHWGQWIGIHSCKTQECLAKNNGAPPQASDFLTVARQFAGMPLDGESVPRFFIVSDDSKEEESIKEMIWNMNLTGAKSAGVVFPSKFKFTHPNSVAGLREIAGQLHLLSKTVLVIGTPGSSLSSAAAAAGESYLVFAEGGNTLVSGGGDIGVLNNATRVEIPAEKDGLRAALSGGSRVGESAEAVAKSRHMAG
ncbi:hypothetical protein Ndes2437B_g00933 [Nannochloris sp. 'desiccata']